MYIGQVPLCKIQWKLKEELNMKAKSSGYGKHQVMCCLVRGETDSNSRSLR